MKKEQARRWIARLIGWTLAFALLFMVSRPNHPTASINALASTIFVIAAAIASYVDRLWLVPRLAACGRRVAYAGALALTVFFFTLVVVVSIQAVYRWLWHPDSRMFGFWTNVALDFLVIATLVAGAKALQWVVRAVSAP